MNRPVIWFCLVSLIWGMTFAAARMALETVPPIFLSGIRYLLVFVLMAPALGGLGRAFAPAHLPRLVLSALFCIAAAYGLLFWGMRTTPSGIAGLVNLSIVPVGLYALAIGTGEERPSWRLGGAILLGLGGLVALFWTRIGQGDGLATASGLVAIVIGTLCYCIGSVIARPLLRDLDALTLTAAHSIVGGTVLVAASLVLEPIDAKTVMALSGWRVLVGLFTLSIAGTIVAYTLYLRLMREWGTVRAGFYAFVSPIVALLMGHWVFAEPIGPVEIGGTILLIGAAALAIIRKPDAAMS